MERVLQTPGPGCAGQAGSYGGLEGSFSSSNEPRCTCAVAMSRIAQTGAACNVRKYSNLSENKRINSEAARIRLEHMILQWVDVESWLMVCSSSVEAATRRSISLKKESNTPDYMYILLVLSALKSSGLWLSGICPWSCTAVVSWRQTVSLPHDGEPLVSIRSWLELWLLCMVCVCEV